jgi:hypothetical protein
MGNLNAGGEAQIVKDGSGEAQIVKGLMDGDAPPLPYDISEYDVRKDEQKVPGTRASYVKYLPGAGMGVAVCSVCGLPIQVAVYAGKNGGDVHIRCMPSISIDSNNAHKEVRPLHSRLQGVSPHAILQNTSQQYACKAREKPATVHPKGIPPCVR